MLENETPTAGFDVLNTGHGHLEITWNPEDAADLERARKTIADMMKKGYLFFLEAPDKTMVRVESFDEKAGKYIIGDAAAIPGAEPVEGAPKKGAVKISKAKTTAMGRSAGG